MRVRVADVNCLAGGNVNGNKMMGVEITTQPTFRAGTPTLLFEGQYVQSALWRANYDITPDGQRGSRS